MESVFPLVAQGSRTASGQAWWQLCALPLTLILAALGGSLTGEFLLRDPPTRVRGRAHPRQPLGGRGSPGSATRPPRSARPRPAPAVPRSPPGNQGAEIDPKEPGEGKQGPEGGKEGGYWGG